jgi:ABC-type protease/lipase transport system fused ATPase/permease subunit
MGSPHVGYLPQAVRLFPGSIAENIARMALAPKPDAVIAAARRAGVHDTILRLPDAYDTEIRPDGGPVSGGEAQQNRARAGVLR